MNTPAVSSTAADLSAKVTAVPGVRGIEPGISSTLRALDAHIRRSQAQQARYGLIIDPEQATVTVEIGVDDSRPVREVVRDTQRAIQQATDGTGSAPMTIQVRVQSVAQS